VSFAFAEQINFVGDGLNVLAVINFNTVVLPVPALRSGTII
jgi:hypothetical protein